MQRSIVCVLSATEWLVSNVSTRILIGTYKFRTANKALLPLHIFPSRNTWHPFVEHNLRNVGLAGRTWRLGTTRGSGNYSFYYSLSASRQRLRPLPVTYESSYRRVQTVRGRRFCSDCCWTSTDCLLSALQYVNCYVSWRDSPRTASVPRHMVDRVCFGSCSWNCPHSPRHCMSQDEQSGLTLTSPPTFVSAVDVATTNRLLRPSWSSCWVFYNPFVPIQFRVLGGDAMIHDPKAIFAI